MLKKKIEYVDFNGIERKEDYYFHLSTPELVRMEAKYNGDIMDYIVNALENEDFKAMVDVLEELILTSVGEKSNDGRSFIKNKEIREEFEHSQAYAELFEEIFTSKDVSQSFGRGLIEPAKVDKNKQEQQQQIREIKDSH